jgi:hypothetical protein
VVVYIHRERDPNERDADPARGEPNGMAGRPGSTYNIFGCCASGRGHRILSGIGCRRELDRMGADGLSGLSALFVNSGIAIPAKGD